MIHDRSHIVQDDQRSVDASDGVVADAGLDVGHPGVDKLGHGGQFESSTDSALDREDRMVGEQSGMNRGVGQAVSTTSRWSSGGDLPGARDWGLTGTSLDSNFIVL